MAASHGHAAWLLPLNPEAFGIETPAISVAGFSSFGPAISHNGPLTQSGRDTVELSSRISGFVPRLAAKPGRPPWTGTLYDQVQSRIHVAISRRYFSRLARGNS